MYHIEELTASKVYLYRAFNDGESYGDDYVGEMIICFYNTYIEVKGLKGIVSRKHYKEGIKYLRQLSSQHRLPIRAERANKHKLPSRDFKSVDGMWYLKGK